MRQIRVALCLGLLVMLGAADPPRLLAGQTSRVFAVWPHSDYKPWQADIYAREPDFVARELDWMSQVGINTYLPLALSSGRVNWPSERFPDTRELFGARSPLDLAVHGGDERGIATQLYLLAGFVGFLEDPWAAPDLRANPEWDVVGASGQGTLSGQAGTATSWGTFLWWDLGHPAVQERLLGMLDEALDRYPTVEGVHLDYIRDPGLGGCFSAACLERFQSASGRLLPALPDAARRAAYIREHHLDEYTAWRTGEITNLVRRIREHLDRKRPGLTLAADVFPSPEWAYRGVFQDWRRWAAEGLVDAVYPMFYAEARDLWTVEDYLRDTLTDLDRRAAATGRPRAAVVLGVSTAWYDQVPPEQAEDLISRALRAGAAGVALQCLPYWWQQEYQQFRRAYLPRSASWAPLWDYDATLERLFRQPQPAGAAADRTASVWPPAESSGRRLLTAPARSGVGPAGGSAQDDEPAWPTETR